MHYYFVSVEEFETLIEKGHFLEYAKVFGGNYYGTSLPAIEENLAKGIDVFLDIDWQGAQQISSKSTFCKKHFYFASIIARIGASLGWTRTG